MTEKEAIWILKQIEGKCLACQLGWHEACVTKNFIGLCCCQK